MSLFDESIHQTTPRRQFDLLVDGELSEADRRALLVQLEHETDGWRRCALAFLEAQCWKAELGQIAAPAAQAKPTVSQVAPIGRRQSWRQYAATTLTVVASFLIALVVVRGWSGSSSHSTESSLLKTAVSEFPLANPHASPAASPVVRSVPAVPAADRTISPDIVGKRLSDLQKQIDELRQSVDALRSNAHKNPATRPE